MSAIAKFVDSDTGESTLDVVEVPEGWSFQMAYRADSGIELIGGYISVILSPDQASELLGFLQDAGVTR